jgi:hypothetical protein
VREDAKKLERRMSGKSPEAQERMKKAAERRKQLMARENQAIKQRDREDDKALNAVIDLLRERLGADFSKLIDLADRRILWRLEFKLRATGGTA